MTDLRVDRPLTLSRLRDGMELAPFLDAFNLFNHAPPRIYPITSGLLGTFGSLNFDYGSAPAGQTASDLDAARGRLNPTRRLMIGVRVNF